jgi:hypothetical protein
MPSKKRKEKEESAKPGLSSTSSFISQNSIHIGQTPSSEEFLRLRCYIEHGSGVFTVKAQAPMQLEVGNLKGLIQKMWENSILKGVDSNSLDLWKVGVVCENNAK